MKGDEPTRAALDWDDLRVFLAVAEAGSVNGAARALKLTPSAVLRRIEGLEHRLEARLFNRSSAGMTLSEAGRELRSKAFTMQRVAESIDSSVRHSDRRIEGRLTIAAPDGLAAYAIAPELPEFLRAHPQLRVHLDCGFRPSDPARDPADITITVSSETARPDDILQPLGFMHYVLFASERYLQDFGAPPTLASIADHRILHHTAQTYQRATWDRRAEALQHLAEPALVTNSSAAMFMALQAGAGIGAIPTYILQHAPDLRIVESELLPRIQFWATYRRDAKNIARMRAGLSWLRTIFDPRTRPWFREEFVHPRDFEAVIGAL